MCRAGRSTHLSEHQLSIHMHGQVSKVQEHLVCGQLLLDDIIPIDGHDGHTDEQVEVVSLQRDRQLRGVLPSLSQSSSRGLTPATWVWACACRSWAPGKQAIIHFTT